MFKSVVGIHTVKKNPQRAGAAGSGTRAVKRSAHGVGSGPGLGNNANSSSAIMNRLRNESRKARYELRAQARKVSFAAVDSIADAPRVCNCGWAVSNTASGVGIRVSSGQAGFSGTQSCGSVWLCAYCASKVAAKRADELGAVLGWARREKHTLAMVTLTVSHKRRDALTEVWDSVSSGWESVTSGSSWVSETEEAFEQRLASWYSKGQDHEGGKLARVVDSGAPVPRAPRGWHKNTPPTRRIGDQETYGVLGWARATEVTHGGNGWHVHIHAVLVLEGNQDADSRAEKLGGRMRDRWNKGIGKKGFSSSEEHGVRIDVSAGAEKKLADYLAKSIEPEGVVRASVEAAGRSLAREATLGQMKKGRLKGRSPFQILEDTKNGEARDFALWAEWMRGSHGRRQLTWSAKLREIAGLVEEEMNDEEIAAQEIGTEADTVLVLPQETWREVRSTAWEILELAEKGTRFLTGWLDSRGLAWEPPPPSEDSQSIDPQ